MKWLKVTVLFLSLNCKSTKINNGSVKDPETTKSEDDVENSEEILETPSTFILTVPNSWEVKTQNLETIQLERQDADIDSQEVPSDEIDSQEEQELSIEIAPEEVGTEEQSTKDKVDKKTAYMSLSILTAGISITLIYYNAKTWNEELLHVKQIIPSNTEVQVMPDSLKFVSLNTYLFPKRLGFLHPRTNLSIEERITKLGTFINNQKNADFVLLQEIWGDKNKDELFKSLGENGAGFKQYKPDTLGRYFVGIDSGLMILSKHEVLRQGFAVYDTTRVVDRLARKGVFMVEVLTPQGPLIIANTHLQAGGGGVLSKIEGLFGTPEANEIKKRQIKQMADAIAEFAGDKKVHLVIAGDFNADIKFTPTTRATNRDKFEEIVVKALEESQLSVHEAVENKIEVGQLRNTDFDNKARPDHVLATDGVEILSPKILETHRENVKVDAISDHHALGWTTTFKEGKKATLHRNQKTANNKSRTGKNIIKAGGLLIFPTLAAFFAWKATQSLQD